MPDVLGTDPTPKLSAAPSVKDGQGWYAQAKEYVQQGIAWLKSWTFAAKVAWLVFFVLAGIVALFWTMLWNRNNVPWVDSLSAERYETLALVFLIPLMVYRMVSVWTTGVESHQPDIRSAWDRALKELKRAGIPIDATPIYLVVGSSGQRLERRMMSGLNKTFLVKPESLDNHPLHVYANRNAIYLFCSDCSWTNEIADRLESAGVRPVAPGGGEHSRLAQHSAESVSLGHSRSFTGATVELTDFDQMPNMEEMPPESFAHSPTGTLRSDPGAAGIEDSTAMMTADESARQLQRLSYVCRLIQSVREPLCPINGVVVLSPFQILERSDAETEQYHRAVRGDLLTIQQTLMLKAPVVSLFVGLEKVRGFQELVRRIGQKGAETRRFGKGYELRAAATVGEMQRYSQHLTGVFEDWIYRLFCAEDALSRPGNTLLYELLSTIRTRLKTHLASILSLGFGHDAKTGDNDDMIRFAGCYFASTGERNDEQAFYQAVFAKLESMQEEVEWTGAAVKRQSSLALSVSLAIGVMCLSVLGLGAMFYLHQAQ